MSAQSGRSSQRVNNDLGLLAPQFAGAVRDALAACQAKGLDAKVYEAYRSNELQAIYYARGRTVIPPHHTVTNAPTNLFSWHGYGLAVDVVHRTEYWEPPGGESWFEHVAAVFKQHLCSWGGDWKHPDTPHFQWHLCKPSPSAKARELLLKGGRPLVWQAVNAV